MIGSATAPDERRREPALADFRDAHRGETIIVCGCGESLNVLEHPERFVTIGVNDVGRKFDPTYLVVLNLPRQFAPGRFEYIERSRARYLFTQLDLGVTHPGVVKFGLGRYGGTTFSDPDRLNYTGNSAYVALCLAAHMGARRIGMIGVDFTEHHFFGRTGAHPLTRPLPQIDREYARLAEALSARGIDVVNLSPTSRLTGLPRAALDTFGSPAVPATAASRPVTPTRKRRIFFVNYSFLTCGDVFATGLAHAAVALGVEYDAGRWDDPTLPARIRAFAPDLVFVVHGRRAAQRWAAELREWNTAVWLVDEPYEVDDTSSWSSAFDTVFVNDSATVTRHRNAHLLPVCFDPLLHRKNGTARDYRVGFIGGYNPVRERCLIRLAEEKLLSYVVGGPWKAATLRRLAIAERTTPAATAQLYQRTKIVINVFRSEHHFNRAGVRGTSLNPRVFEALACGALVVSEPRPELTAMFPEVLTFSTDAELVALVRHLLDNPVQAADLLAASRARLVDQDYAARLASVLAIALGEPRRTAGRIDSHPREPVVSQRRVNQLTESRPTAIQTAMPDGWEVVGPGVAERTDAALTLRADAEHETGLATTLAFDGVGLSFDVRLDARCCFIAKVQHASRGDREANSYHLVATPDRAYVARHHVVMAPAAVARGVWQRVEMMWRENMLTVSIDGRDVCRCADATLESGHCFVGVTGGAVEVRALQANPVPHLKSCTVVDGWSIAGRGTVVTEGKRLILSASGQNDVSLVSVATDNDVELAFWVLLDDRAHLIAKIHHQSRENPDANSYHLVSRPGRAYLARHGHILADVRLARRVWQRIRLRWADQRLELFVNDRRRVRVTDNLLQSGACVVGVSGGRVDIRGLAARDLSPLNAPARLQPDVGRLRPGRDTLPFTTTPRRNLLYHVWPVRGETWRWNVKQLRSRIDLFNGRRIVGIVHDGRSEHPDEVRRMLDGCGCEFVVAPNGPSGEGLTFPTMLEQVRSVDPNEVTFYAHAKGVKYEPAVPPPVRRWAETQYRVALDDWPLVRSQLERYAMTGSFKMLGRFRAHHYLGDWHYSGTFFWLRHAFVFARNLATPNGFYGCVEAWPGVHFRNDETDCLFMDALRELPYQEEFWTTSGNPALARWEATRPPLVPPASLQNPAPFDGCDTPRLEQHAEEFAWFLDALEAVSPRQILCIGSLYGGVEWHIARRFRALGRDIRITAVDLEPRPELLATIHDARLRFNQQVDLVVGDSALPTTRARLDTQYDAVFIDGDHGYQGARADVDFALTRSPRLVALHDIADSDWHAQARCCVSRVWSELCSQYATEERVVGGWGGLGIVRL